MCQHGDTITAHTYNGKVIDVDRCIAPLVMAINGSVSDFETIASCCGHGHRPGSILYRKIGEAQVYELLLMTFEQGRELDHLWPNIHGVHNPGA